MANKNIKESILFLIFFGATLFTAHSQNTLNKELNLMFGFGVSTLKLEDEFKINAISREATLSFDVFKVNQSSSIFLGLEYSHISGDFIDNSISNFVSNKYINMPLYYRLRKSGGNNFTFFTDVGLYGSFLINSTIESGSEEIELTGFNANLGTQATFGGELEYDEYVKFNFGIKIKGDIFETSNDVNKYKIVDLYSLNLGASINL
jgi:hypothetical protein